MEGKMIKEGIDNWELEVKMVGRKAKESKE